jgi:hypothetical protein
MGISMNSQSSASITVIETDRLRLRVPNMADWPTYAAFMASERAAHMAVRFRGPPPGACSAMTWRSGS